MVREIGPTRLELHNEKAGKHLAGGDFISLAVFIADQKLIEHGIRMAGYGLPFDVIEVGNGGLRIGCAAYAARGNFEPHDDQAHARLSGDHVWLARNNVEEIVLPQCDSFGYRIESAGSSQHDVGIFFERARHRFTGATRVDRNLTKAYDPARHLRPG